MSKVLLAITCYNGPFYAEATHNKTGLYATEAIHPFEYFRSQGLEVDFVSETGTFGYDEHSLAPEALTGDDLNVYQNAHSEYNISLKNIKKASDVDPSQYKIFFAAGGHGTLYDFPTADGLHKLAQEIWSKQGVIAAVCHGPVIFDNLYDTATGRPLIEGKKVTGFTDNGETAVGVTPILKANNLATVREIVEKNGGTYDVPSGDWVDYAVADGRLVSGVNPMSATTTAAKAVEVANLKLT